MSSTISSHRSARQWCEHGSRARSSTSIAIRAALRFIPVRRRRNSSRRRPSTASRSIGQAERQTRPKSPSGGVFTSILTMRRSPARSLACARSISASRSSTPIPFAQSSRACSTASCQCSISARIPARAAIPDCARRLAPCWRRAGKRPSSTGASRAAGSRAPTASPSEGVEALQLELACRAYMQEPSVRRPRTGRRRSTKSARRRRARRSSACSRRFSRT